MTTKKRLTAEDWTYAAFRALATKGPAGVKAEAIARDLNTTKGSFYWHFKDVSALRDAMLKLWREKGYVDVAKTMDAIPNPRDRIRALLTTAVTSHDPIYGGAAAEPALRAWARNDAIVADVVKRVDAARMAYLTSLLETADVGDAALARSLYGMFIGLSEIELNDGQSNAPALNAMLDAIL